MSLLGLPLLTVVTEGAADLRRAPWRCALTVDSFIAAMSADELLKKADKKMGTTLMRWKPDYEAASALYEEAGGSPSHLVFRFSIPVDAVVVIACVACVYFTRGGAVKLDPELTVRGLRRVRVWNGMSDSCRSSRHGAARASFTSLVIKPTPPSP